MNQSTNISTLKTLNESFEARRSVFSKVNWANQEIVSLQMPEQASVDTHIKYNPIDAMHYRNPFSIKVEGNFQNTSLENLRITRHRGFAIRDSLPLLLKQ